MDAQETLKLLKAEVQSIACWGPRGGKQYFDAGGDERELVLDLIDHAIAGTLHLPPPRSESRRPVRVRAGRQMGLPDGPADPKGEYNARVHVWRRPDGRIFHDIVHSKVEDDEGPTRDTP